MLGIVCSTCFMGLEARKMPLFTAYTVWICCFRSATMGAFNILTLTCRLGRYSERPSLSSFSEEPAW